MTSIYGRLPETGQTVTVTLDGAHIASVEVGEEGPPAGPVLGGPDVWVAPGFLDLQVNGYGGHDFNHGARADAGEVSTELEPIYALAARAGTPLLCPTVTTNSRARMIAALRALAQVLDANPDLDAATPAIHVEGPYLSSEDGPRGAHLKEESRDPDWDEFQALQEAAGGRVRLLTLAPERPGALEFIERLVEAGVVVALGHTGAEPETIRDAVQAGARVSTHLGNGAHAQIRRHPNYIWEQLAHDGLTTTAIADGHHLPAAVVKVIARVKGAARMALVSDAVSLGGLPPGRYEGGRLEILPTGKIVLADTPYLFGAGHLLDSCVANTLRFTGCTLAEAVRMASTTPAEILGLGGRKGSVAPGFDADLTLFRLPGGDGPLEIVATLTAGKVAYRA